MMNLVNISKEFVVERKECGDKKTNLLVKVARMYYEQGMSQEEIAKDIQCSRPYVSRLLTDAKDEGIVQVKVIPPKEYEQEMEQRLKQVGGLEKVIIVPEKSNSSKLNMVAKAAAEYLENTVKNGEVIGFSWGNTVYAVTNFLSLRRDLSDVTVVQLCGGISNLQNNIYSSEIAKNFAKAWNAKPYAMMCPALVDSKEIKDVFISDSNIRKVVEYGYKADTILITMGAYGMQNAVYRAGYLEEGEMQELIGNGAVGDICDHVINIDGEICDLTLDARTVSVPLKELKKKKKRIGVAAGQSKVECICGAIRGNIINILITDEETAGKVLERLGND